MRYLQIFSVIGIWLAVASCSLGQQENSAQGLEKREFSGTAAEVISIAKQYLDERGISYANTNVVANVHADAWWVLFSDEVPKPGGDFVVRVSHEGEVLGIDPGF